MGLKPSRIEDLKYGTQYLKKTKNASSFDLFKKEIGKWKGEKCPCRICKTYIQHVGFI